ncbi:MAG: hypothetical protein A2X94_05745 [Bdellovibrionales bacterium GWB1_55_8]|nr:MAG: hypothetical protein A2X94_05745 [Bdellovibrionales bacterium GWB1_55_8]
MPLQPNRPEPRREYRTKRFAALSAWAIALAISTAGVFGYGSSWADGPSADALASNASTKQVQSVDQFKWAMHQHRVKVKALALDILNRHRAEFPQVSDEVLSRYIATVHDAGKFRTEKARQLFGFWGKDIGKLPESERVAALAVVRELNDAEKKSAARFFASHGISPDVRPQFEKIEKLADGIDRWGARLSLEEFNRSAMKPTSEFFDDATIKRIAQEYEADAGSRYLEATSGMHYEDLVRGGFRTPRRAPAVVSRKDGCLAGNLAALATSRAAVVFRDAASLRPMINRLSSVRDPVSFGEALTRRAELLTQSAKTARQMDTRTAERFYAAIRDQIPKDGYIRALSASEVNTILKEGRMGRGYDFTFRNSGARVGHSSNFIFLRCRDCPQEFFQAGNLGSGVVNRQPIPLDKLEFIIPEVPIQ